MKILVQSLAPRKASRLCVVQTASREYSAYITPSGRMWGWALGLSRAMCRVREAGEAERDSILAGFAEQRLRGAW